MAGETIIVADNKAVSLRLTRIYLVNEGYKVVTASSGVEALDLLRSLTPDLVFADLDSPDCNSLELARRIKDDERTRAIPALAAAPAGEEARALDSGADGFLTRPIETRALGERIREILARRPASPPAAAKNLNGKDSNAVEMQALRTRFLSEGRDKSRDLLLQLDGAFDAEAAKKTVHQWIGTGGLLGYASISRLARESEAILSEQPFDGAQLREALANIALAFSSPREAREEPLPPSIVESLHGKRIIAVEFPPHEQERLRVALDRVGAESIFLTAAQIPAASEEHPGDMILVHINEETAHSRWIDPARPFAAKRPTIFVGKRDDLAALPQASQALAREFLMDSWQPEEALVRLSLAATYQPPERAKPQTAIAARTRVLIADDDPAVLSLVRTALENFGMDCDTAADGALAIEAIRELRPHAAVLDVNMPNMDGFEVLAAVRREEMPLRVLLLTARQQENDIIRGFTLGADDYVVKPFSPMELVARLKRLLSR